MKTDIELQSLSRRLRRSFGIDLEAPINIFNVVLQIPNITLVRSPLSKNISGMCYKDLKLIIINTKMSLGRQNFTLAHELYHYYFDENINTVCTLSNFNNSESEKEADNFASYFLAPYDSLKEFIDGKKSIKTPLERLIVDVEQKYGISRKATLFRLKKENYITTEEYNIYCENVISSALKYGYDTSLYLNTNKISTTNGYYIELVNKLYNDNFITKGKYNELLLEAFREDLLYVEGLDNDYFCD